MTRAKDGKDRHPRPKVIVGLFSREHCRDN